MFTNLKESLLKEYKDISKALNYTYNQLMLAETEEQEQQLQRDIDVLELLYKDVSHRLDTLYDEL